MAIKKTLLEMTQKILSSMDSDEVNSISDTVEATQVAEIIEEVYENMVVEIDLPQYNTLTVFTALGDTARPTHMLIPDEMGPIKWVKYNNLSATDTDLQLTEITYLEPEAFHDYVSRRNETNTNVTKVTDFAGTYLLIKNDKNPQYYTSFDDEYVIFDSYDSDIESSLQSSKISVYASKIPTFTLSDSFTPDLPDRYFPLLRAESKALAFVELKQISHNKSERTARTQRVKLQKDKKRTGADHAYNTNGRP